RTISSAEPRTLRSPSWNFIAAWSPANCSPVRAIPVSRRVGRWPAPRVSLPRWSPHLTPLPLRPNRSSRISRSKTGGTNESRRRRLGKRHYKVSLSGRFDGQGALEVDSEFAEILKEKSEVVVDLSQVI